VTRVVGEDLLLLLRDLHEGLGVVQVAHARVPRTAMALRFLLPITAPTPERPGRAVQVVDHGGEQHLVLAGQADRRHAHQRVLVLPS
jgi:hypothetical protein